MKKLFGLIFLLIGLVGVAAGGAGIFYSGSIAAIKPDVEQSLETTKAALVQTKDVLAEASTALTDVEKTIGNASQSIDGVSADLSTTMSGNVVDSVATIQTMVDESVMGSVTMVEDAFDTLEELALGLEESGQQETLGRLFGTPDFSLDFLLAYQPEVSMKDSVSQVSSDLGDISKQLQTIDTNLSDTLATSSQDVAKLADDVNAIKVEVEGYNGLLDQYIAQIDKAHDNLGTIFGRVQMGVIIFLIWVIVVSIPPIYLGWALLSGEL